jgi:hypothetical protein
MLRVTQDALEFALAHVERHGDTDILPPAFEQLAIRWSWPDVKNYLAGEDLDLWSVRPLRKCLSPKGPLGYRIATQLDPLDSLLLTALVFEVGESIERARIPSETGVVLSHRFEPDPNGRLYSREFTYEAFRRRSLELADTMPTSWVVLTDIADFYPRLYAHPLENALNEAVPQDHARVIAKFIRNWNYGVSYGIPVGPAATRLLAELCIADVDAALLGEGITFCRYSDDFRIFAATRPEALKQLTFLANVLHQNHGLTLQEAKTEVIPANIFALRFRETAEQGERRRLEANFYELLDRLGIDTYETLDYDDLAPEQQQAVDELNLSEIVEDQITRADRVDIALTGFALRRLGQVGQVTPDLADLLLENIAELTVVFREVLYALAASETPGTPEYRGLMQRVLTLMDHPSLSHLEYYKLWILTLFEEEHAAHVGQWQRLYATQQDPYTRRELILAMGFAANQAWIRSRRHSVFDLGDWERRAYLAAAGCLPTDEAQHWFRSINPRLDRLEQWVAAWAKEQPIEVPRR